MMMKITDDDDDAMFLEMQYFDHQQPNISCRTRKFSRLFFLFATKEMRSMFGLHERVYFNHKSPIRMHHPAYLLKMRHNK